MDLRFERSLPETNSCDVLPQQGDLGISNARLIAPGDLVRSVLSERMNRRDVHGMPPVGSNRVDNVGLTLIRNWIVSLPGC